MPTTASQTRDDDLSTRDRHISPSLRAIFGTPHVSQEPLVAEDQNAVNRYRAPVSERPAGTPDESLQQDMNGHVLGGASEFAFLQLAKQKLASLPGVSIDFSDYPLPDNGNLPPVLPSKDLADQLVRIYFDFGLSTSRFVHEPSLIRGVDALYSGHEIARDELALVYMVLALGSHYSKFQNMFCGYSASVRFYRMAHTQLQRESDKITLATSQARLLIIHYLLNHARMHEAWSIFGVLVRHIQALGLHRRSRSANGNRINHEYRKRLFWCVYINDRIISSMFGRPCAIHDDDVDQEECTLANDEDITESECRPTENGVFCTAAALVYYARLAQILGKILRYFYGPSAKLHNIFHLYATADSFDKALIEWQNSLPPYLNYVLLPQSAASMTAQRQMCTLKLMFAHASLLLYRPFILHAIDISTDKGSERNQWVRQCHEKSIEAANTVVAECKYLHHQGLFSRVFWLVTYTQFAAIGTLFMYSYLWPEDNAVRKTAEEALEQFPGGIAGDLVGQRYLATLEELREITRPLGEFSTILSSSAIEESGRILGEGNDSIWDEGSWPNLFFDPALMDDLLGHHETHE